MNTFFLVITLAIMFCGLVGTILPIIPSVPIIYAAYFLYGLGTAWKDYGFGLMVCLGGLTVFVVVMDYLAGAVGARKFGGSREGMIGSIILAFIGFIYLNLPGLILGTFGGALLGELINGRNLREATRSGLGALLGFLAGSLFKMMTSIVMIGLFLALIIW